MRKFWIFTELDHKNKEQQANTNVYAKVVTEQSTIEMYRKEDVVKQVIAKNGTDVVLTQLTKPEYRIFYTDDGARKTMNIYEEEFLLENQNIIVNYMDYVTISEKLKSCVGSKIKSETVEGTDCYVISGFNTNFVYDANAIDWKFYLAKDTGLAVKWVETVKENEKVEDRVVTYEYRFNQVTEEDVTELDRSLYEMQENS